MEYSIDPNTVAMAYRNLKLLELVYSSPRVRGDTFIERKLAVELHRLELARFQGVIRKPVQEGRRKHIH